MPAPDTSSPYESEVPGELVSGAGSSEDPSTEMRQETSGTEMRTAIRTRVPRSEGIFGEKFHVKIEGGNVVISHPEWSLVGVGRNKIEAKEDLYREIGELSEIYLEESPLEMSRGALDMRGFLYKIRKYESLFEAGNPLISRK